MFPLLFIPGDTTNSKDTPISPVSYDLKCSEEFGCGAMNVTINVLEKRNVGEPVYGVTVNTVKVGCVAVPTTAHHVLFIVKVMPDMTVSQYDTGEVTSGLVTHVWTTRRVMKLHSGDKEIITRHVRNKGDFFTVENVFGDIEPLKTEKESRKTERKDKRKVPKANGKHDAHTKDVENLENENIMKYPASTLGNFLSEPAAVLMEKMFAQKKVAVNLTDLKTLNDTGDIVKVAYTSTIKDEAIEIIKTLSCRDCEDIVIKNVIMNFNGDILTCKYEDITWINDEQKVKVSNVRPL